MTTLPNPTLAFAPLWSKLPAVTSETASKKTDYNADDLSSLKGLEAVRKKPGMYIGGTDERALHHCVSEVLDNSVDEFLAGHCTHIDVTIHSDGSISIRDNGRGIPVDINKEEGIPGVELVLTRLHSGGKYGQGNYEYSGGTARRRREVRQCGLGVVQGGGDARRENPRDVLRARR